MVMSMLHAGMQKASGARPILYWKLAQKWQTCTSNDEQRNFLCILRVGVECVAQWCSIFFGFKDFQQQKKHHFIAPLLSLCKKERGAKRSRASSGAPEPLCHRTCPGLLQSFAQLPTASCCCPGCGSTIATALGWSHRMLTCWCHYCGMLRSHWPLRLQCLRHLSLLRCVSKGVRKNAPCRMTQMTRPGKSLVAGADSSRSKDQLIYRDIPYVTECMQVFALYHSTSNCHSISELSDQYQYMPSVLINSLSWISSSLDDIGCLSCWWTRASSKSGCLLPISQNSDQDRDLSRQEDAKSVLDNSLGQTCWKYPSNSIAIIFGMDSGKKMRYVWTLMSLGGTWSHFRKTTGMPAILTDGGCHSFPYSVASHVVERKEFVSCSFVINDWHSLSWIQIHSIVIDAMAESEWVQLNQKAGGSHEPMMTNRDGTRILKPVDEADRLAAV